MTRSIQLVIPMAGVGSRFAKAGYKTLKPLIPVHGTPMISIVVANLMSEQIGHVILVCQRETMEKVNLREIVNVGSAQLTILCVDKITDGPASTVEIARPAINMELPLVIANSDQFIDKKLDKFYDQLQLSQVDGSILTMRDSDPKWSYAVTDQSGFLDFIKEKEVVSELATVGIYGFSHAKFAFDGIEKMKNAEDTSNGEYFVGPAYNYLVQEGKRISVVDLGPVSTVMFGLGTPEDYESFVSSRGRRV